MPVRPVAGHRNAHASWLHGKQHILPARKHMIATGPTSLHDTPSSKVIATPAMYALMPNKTTTHLGYEPRTVHEAKRHPSWPLWHAAMVSD